MCTHISSDCSALSLGSQGVWYLEARSSSSTMDPPPMHLGGRQKQKGCNRSETDKIRTMYVLISYEYDWYNLNTGQAREGNVLVWCVRQDLHRKGI